MPAPRWGEAESDSMSHQPKKIGLQPPQLLEQSRKAQSVSSASEFSVSPPYREQLACRSPGRARRTNQLSWGDVGSDQASQPASKAGTWLALEPSGMSRRPPDIARLNT